MVHCTPGPYNATVRVPGTRSTGYGGGTARVPMSLRLRRSPNRGFGSHTQSDKNQAGCNSTSPCDSAGGSRSRLRLVRPASTRTSAPAYRACSHESRQGPDAHPPPRGTRGSSQVAGTESNACSCLGCYVDSYM
eukprot:3211442-Rhodomonas_salina.1